MKHIRIKPAWNKDKKMNYSPKALAGISEGAKKTRADCRIEIKCANCGKKIIARSPARKYCDECVKTVYNKGGGYPPNIMLREWRVARDGTLERDNHICRICGRKWEIGERQFDVHHIDENGYTNSDEPNNSPDNLITLCRECHLAITRILEADKQSREFREKYKDKKELFDKLLLETDKVKS